MCQSNNIFKLFGFINTYLQKLLFLKLKKKCSKTKPKLLELPYNALVYLLGPLVRQINIREQFYVRNYRFL